MVSFTKKLLIGLLLWIIIGTYLAVQKVRSGSFHPNVRYNPTLIQHDNIEHSTAH